MILRLLLVLLLAAFAVPPAAAAAPVCHAPAAATMAGHDAPAHHGTPAPDRATVAHVCVGCVPMADWLGARVPPPIPAPAAAPAVRNARLDLRHGGTPALPPPRLG